MSRAMRRKVGWLLVPGLALLSTVSCNSILGINKPIKEQAGEGGQGGSSTSTTDNTGSTTENETSGDVGGAGGQNGEGCVLNTDCDKIDEKFVCIFGVCSPACEGDRDCEAGLRCLIAEDGAACITPEQAECTDTEDCPSNNVCFDQTCRIDCSSDDDACQADQTCTSSGICKGSDPEHDPVITGAGEECDDEGALRCVETGSVLRVECKDGVWLSYDSCEDGELCDPEAETAGSCKEIPADCEGRKANESFCDERIRKTCGPTLLTVETDDCPSIQHCSLATGPKCAACLPNTYQCDDTVLLECASDLTGFVEKADCADIGKPCSETAGDCTEYACSAGQKRCGDNDVLEVCNAERSGFVKDEQCGAGLCDSQNLVCDKCVANSKSCDSGGNQVVCSADGSTETQTACPMDRPICSAGNCVQCTGKDQCPSGGDCSDPVCNANFCDLDPVDRYEPCTGGYCDGTGSCRQCLNDDHCPDQDDCNTGSCNASKQCIQTANDPGDACNDNGGHLCDGNGSCVACIPSNLNFCPDVGDCYDKTCSGNVCDQRAKSSGSCNENGGIVCDGNGRCVECNGPSDCGGGTPVCLNNNCVECTPNPNPTQCESACSRVPQYCDSSGFWANANACTGNQYCEKGACTSATKNVGNDQQGSTGYGGLANIALAQPITVNCRSTLVNVGAYFSAAAGQVRFGVYSDNNNKPGSLLAISSAVGVQSGLNIATTSPAVSLAAGTTYWIALNLSSASAQLSYDPGGTTLYVSHSFSDVNGPLPATFGTPSTWSNTVSMYAVVRPNP